MRPPVAAGVPSPAHEQRCPCGSGQGYPQCCGPLHAGQPAATAERLMRSRYSAFVLGLESYLLATWHPRTRPPALQLQATRWLGLEVRQHDAAGDTASVEFVARYKLAGKAHRLHEKSRFLRENDRWFYVDGEFPDPPRARA